MPSPAEQNMLNVLTKVRSELDSAMEKLADEYGDDKIMADKYIAPASMEMFQAMSKMRCALEMRR